MGSSVAVTAATAIQANWRCSVQRAKYVSAQRQRRAATSTIARSWSHLVAQRQRQAAALTLQRGQRGRHDRLLVASGERTESANDDLAGLEDQWRAEDLGMLTVPSSVTCCCILATDPLVTVADGFLSQSECDALIACATSWRRSGVSTEIGHGSTSAGRTSMTANARPALERAMAPLRTRLQLFLGVDASRLEASQLLYYEAGGAYRWHYDAYNEATPRGRANTRRRGQRLSTTIIYLNDVADGGETAFYFLRRAVAPRAGRLLTFRNVTAPDGKLHRRSFHAGLPVASGAKWIVTTFVRERAS